MLKFVRKANNLKEIKQITNNLQQKKYSITLQDT